MAQRRLFSQASMMDVKLSQKDRLKKEFAKLTDDQISDQPTLERFKQEYAIDVPTLLEEKKEATTRLVKIDVSQDRSRMIWDRDRPFYIDATEITVHIPFEGDGGVFDIRPPSLTLSEMRGDVRGKELLLIATITREGIDVAGFLEREIGYVRHNLEQLRAQVNNFDQELEQELNGCLHKHRQKMVAHSNISLNLGMPVRATTSTEPFPTPTRPAPAKSLPKAKTHSWDVFISHANEDKDDLARPLANALAERGLRVWFDEFTLSVGDSLRQSIEKGLAQSRYGIVILSPAFFGRHWPEQELNGLATKEVGGTKVILPIWHKVGHSEVAGVSPTLADRLAVLSSKGIDHIVDELLRAMGTS